MLEEQKNTYKRFRSHKNRIFKDVIEQYGENAVKFEIIKETSDDHETCNKEEVRETLRCYLNGDKIINNAFGNFFKSSIDKAINKFNKCIDDSNFNEFYELLKYINNRPNTNRKVDKSKPSIVFKITDKKHGDIFIGKNFALDIEYKLNNSKIVNDFKEDAELEFEKIGIFDYEESFKQCTLACLDLFCNNEKLINKTFGKFNRKMFENMRQVMKNFNTEVAMHEIECANKKMYRIYKITNLITNGVLIGRTQGYLFASFNYFSECKYDKMHDIFKQYGSDNFKIEELCVCESENEQYKKFNNIVKQYKDNYEYEVYNSRIGTKMSKEERKKLSEDIKAHKRGEFGQLGNIPWNKGIPHTEKAKAKMRESHKGQRPSEYCKQRSLEVLTGKKQPKEQIEKRVKNLTKKVICINTGEVYDNQDEVRKKFKGFSFKKSENHLPCGVLNGELLYFKVTNIKEKQYINAHPEDKAYVQKICDEYHKSITHSLTVDDFIEAHPIYEEREPSSGKVLILKVTDLSTGFALITKTSKKVSEFAYMTTKLSDFKQSINAYGKNILNIDFLKEVDKSDMNNEILRETLRCAMNGDKILNKYYGCVSSSYVDKMRTKNPELNCDELVDKIISQRGIRKEHNEPYVAFYKEDSGCFSFYNLPESKVKNLDNCIVLCKGNVNENKAVALKKMVEIAFIYGYDKIKMSGALTKSKAFNRILSLNYEDRCLDLLLSEFIDKTTYRVYQLKNLINNRIFIARTSWPIASFIGTPEKHNCDDSEIYNDLKKFGVSNFSIKILATANSKEEAIELEKKYVESLCDENSYFNIYFNKIFFVFKISYNGIVKFVIRNSVKPDAQRIPYFKNATLDKIKIEAIAKIPREEFVNSDAQLEKLKKLVSDDEFKDLSQVYLNYIKEQKLINAC